MYRGVKSLASKVLSKNLLFRLEPYLRGIYASFYLGKSYQCNICETNFRNFISLENGHKLCPKCGSSGRDRRLFSLLEADGFLDPKLTHLDFSPSRSLFRRLKSTKKDRYTASDISGDFLADVNFDITQMKADENSYDLITCYHVLEHVENDESAMKELYRILKPGGTCFIQTPFKEGDIYENPEIVSEEERLIHFGQEDHVRIYSLSGLKERLERASFVVEVLEFKNEPSNKFGFLSEEHVLKCSKVKLRKKVGLSESKVVQ